MKVISINLNGIRAAMRKGFYEWLTEVDADIVCLQELKAKMAQLDAPEYYPTGYETYYHDAEKPGYSGVGLYLKNKPLSVQTEFGWSVADHEGRYIQAEFPDLTVISLYLPSGSSGDARQALKFEFLDRLREKLIALRQANREVMICGDWNIAHTKKDIKNWRGNQKNSGFLPEERAFMDEVFGPLGYVDAFRVRNQEDEQYTWWSNRGQAYAKNVGWRIDYQVVTPGLAARVANVAIYTDQRFSDHAPLIITYNSV